LPIGPHVDRLEDASGNEVKSIRKAGSFVVIKRLDKRRCPVLVPRAKKEITEEDPRVTRLLTMAGAEEMTFQDHRNARFFCYINVISGRTCYGSYEVCSGLQLKDLIYRTTRRAAVRDSQRGLLRSIERDSAWLLEELEHLLEFLFVKKHKRAMLLLAEKEPNLPIMAISVLSSILGRREYYTEFIELAGRGGSASYNAIRAKEAYIAINSDFPAGGELTIFSYFILGNLQRAMLLHGVS